LTSFLFKLKVHEYKIPSKEVFGVSAIFHEPQTSSIFVGYKNGGICEFEVKTGKKKFQLGQSTKDKSGITSICCLKKMNYLIFSNEKGTTRVWDISNGKIEKSN
jgi:WD40 repeat protein